jgi:hypothetical protein
MDMSELTSSVFRRGRLTWNLAARAAALWLITAGALPAAHAAKAEIADIDEDLRASIQKEKVKQHKARADQRSKNSGGNSGQNSECGHVDIGNTDNSKGSSAVSQREKTVVITGPVINATNCK